MMSTSLSKLELNLLEMEMASFLTLPELLRLGVAEQRMRRMCQERADHIVKCYCEAECVHLWESSSTENENLPKKFILPKWLQLQAALRPYCFMRSYRNHWQGDTKPLRLALDSKGPIFVEFSVQAQNAKNGSPGIGLVDEVSFQKMNESHYCAGSFLENCGDLSRHASDITFATSLRPASGTMFAAVGPDSKAELVDFVDANAESEPAGQKRYKTNLNWWQVGDERRRRNAAIVCGFFMEKGCLTFYRRSENGHWISSGVVCEGLPEKVVPCLFLFSFMGYAHVWFTGLRPCSPGVCPGCDRFNHGTKGGWMRMP